MNVLSLFSGIDSAYQSLLDAGIKIDNYYACEIDKYAKSVSRYNFPKIIHLGDVKQVDWFGLPKIDILLAGSPCQGFSFAGKQLAFDDPRSALFWEFVRIKNELQPKYFLLENVVMKKEFQQIITDAVGVEPVMINSALVSAQNRKRLYWANFNITQPIDRGILLKDIIEDNIDNVTDGAMRGRYLDDNGKRLDATVDSQVGLTTQRIETRTDGKSNCLTSVQKDSLVIKLDSHKSQNNLQCVAGLQSTKWLNDGKNLQRNFSQGERIYSTEGKCPTISANSGGTAGKGNALITNQNNLNWRKLTTQRIETRTDGKSNCLTSVQKDSLCCQVGVTKANKHNSITRRIYSIDAKCPTITAASTGGCQEKKITTDNVTWRKLTPIEVERLQTYKDNFTQYGIDDNGKQITISNSQRYKMCGNGWNQETITHIFKCIL